MEQFLSRMTLLLNAFVTWITSLSSWMVGDILLAFCLSLMIFGYVIKFFKKLRRIF